MAHFEEQCRFQLRHAPTLAALRALRADMLLLDNCYGCSFMTAGAAAAVGCRQG
jgi:hypothetical protein